MKYVLNSLTTCSSRIGSIKDIERLPGLILETPMLFLYTEGGSVPHLTREVLHMVTKDPQPLNLPISTIAHCQDAVTSFKKGIADFVGLKEYLTYCTLHQTAQATPQGFNDKDTVSIWTRQGRTQLDSDKYMDIIEAFQPDIYHTLCDGDTNNKSSKKRVQKSVDRTSSIFQKCLQRHEKSEVLKKTAVMGVVEGGYSTRAREKSAEEVGKSPVFGVVIDGLHNNGPEVEQLTFEDIKPILETTLKHLPSEKFRVIHGCWNPEMVLKLVEMGIDAFDSSFTYSVTKRCGALVFPNKLDDCITENVILNGTDHQVLPTNDVMTVDSAEPVFKKKPLSEDIENKCPTSEVNNLSLIQQGSSVEKAKDEEAGSSSANRKYEMFLKDVKYADDFTPISKSCTCLTCQKHTRAYIHHLLQTRELLASVLLSIHNLHHYMEFFKNIREALKTNSLDRLKNRIAEGIQVT